MRIAQAHVSRMRAHLCGRFLAAHTLAPYSNPYEPAVIYGGVTAEIRAIVEAHRSTLVWIIDGGQGLPDLLSYIRRLPEPPRHLPRFFVATSNAIANLVRTMGAPVVTCPVIASREADFPPAPLGTKVYFYMREGGERGKNARLYLPVIRRSLPEAEFIVAYSAPPTAPYDSMPAVYASCALGITLDEDEGASATAIELGWMGRRCVSNGELPNAAKWSSPEDVIGIIRQELSLAGTTQEALAAEMRRVTSTMRWLHTETYGEVFRHLSYQIGLYR